MSEQVSSDESQFAAAAEAIRATSAPAPAALDRTEAPAKVDASSQNADPPAPAEDDINSLRARLEKAERDLKTANGRVAPTQQKLAEMQRKAADADRAIAQLKRQPQTQQTRASLKQWEAYRASMPEDAQAIEELFASRLGPLQERLKAFEEQARDRFGRFEKFEERSQITREARSILSVCPDAAVVMYGMDPNDPRARDLDFLTELINADDDDPIFDEFTGSREFGDWVESLPPAIKSALTGEHANHPETIKYFVDRFKAEKQGVAPAANAVDPRAEQLAKQRQAQRADALPPPRGLSSSNSPAGDSDEAKFLMAAAAIKAASKRR